MPTIEWKPCWKKPVQVEYRDVNEKEEINTREGKLFAYPEQDVIIRGIQGEEYPCKKDIFAKTYTTTHPKEAQPFSFSEEDVEKVAKWFFRDANAREHDYGWDEETDDKLMRQDIDFEKEKARKKARSFLSSLGGKQGQHKPKTIICKKCNSPFQPCAFAYCHDCTIERAKKAQQSEQSVSQEQAKKIVEMFASVDDDGEYWGHDTTVGKLPDITKWINEILAGDKHD